MEIAIFTGLSEFLRYAIYLVSTSLLYPVIIILLGLTALLVVEIGMFSFEWLARTGRLKRGSGVKEKGVKKRFKTFLAVFSKHEPKDLEIGVLEAKTLIDGGGFEEGIDVLDDCTTKRFVYASGRSLASILFIFSPSKYANVHVKLSSELWCVSLQVAFHKALLS